MCYFPNYFPVTLEKKNLVLPTLSDQTANFAAHLSLQTCQPPATRTHSFLLAFSFTPIAKFKQLLFSVTEILSTSHVCLTSALQHYPWHFLSANSSNLKSISTFLSSFFLSFLTCLFRILFCHKTCKELTSCYWIDMLGNGGTRI